MIRIAYLAKDDQCSIHMGRNGIERYTVTFHVTLFVTNAFPLHLTGFKHMILKVISFHGGLESQCTAAILEGKRPVRWKSGLLFVKCKLNGVF